MRSDIFRFDLLIFKSFFVKWRVFYYIIDSIFYTFIDQYIQISTIHNFNVFPEVLATYNRQQLLVIYMMTWLFKKMFRCRCIALLLDIITTPPQTPDDASQTTPAPPCNSLFCNTVPSSPCCALQPLQTHKDHRHCRSWCLSLASLWSH